MLKDHNYSKLTFRLPKSGPKSLKWPNLFICLLLQHLSQDCLVSFFFLIFCMKLRNHMYSKLTEPVFLEKFSLALKWARDVQNGPIYSFVRYYKIFLMIDSLVVFFIFCMKLRDHKCWRLTESDFLGKFLLARKRANRLKISPVYLFARFYNIFLRTDSFFFFFFFFLYFAWDQK